MSRHLAQLTAVLVSLAAGCASGPAGPPAVLEDGASPWQRVETEHFVVESNLPSDDRVRQVASEFETLWHAFASVPILGLRPPKEKPIVVVLRSTSEYRYLAGNQSAGMFIPDTVLGPLILLPPGSNLFNETVIKHELAHFIASGSVPTSLLWLHEGLAMVMQTATYDTHDGEILFGSHSPSLVLGASFALPAQSFMGTWPASQTEREQLAYYGRSWLLVHYLVDYELQGFLNFLVRFRNGEDWKTAWDREILMRWDGIDDALERYHGRASYGLWRVEAHLPDLQALETYAVSASEALALRAVLLATSTNPERERSENFQAASRDLESARELDPDSARVRAISKALAANPEDTRTGHGR